MGKHTVEWHKGCLESSIEYARALEERRNNLDREIHDLKISNNTLSAQIERAERMGKSEFDSGRFGPRQTVFGKQMEDGMDGGKVTEALADFFLEELSQDAEGVALWVDAYGLDIEELYKAAEEMRYRQTVNMEKAK